MTLDEMTARARRLAELEAATHARHGALEAEYEALVARAAALGQPVPAPVRGQIDAVLSARARELEDRGDNLDALDRLLGDWRRHLDQYEGDAEALSALRTRLTRMLAAEVGELSPNEVSRLVARALGDRARTGPLAPLGVDHAPTSGVEQEAQLLEHLIDDEDGFEPAPATAHPPVARPPAARPPASDPAPASAPGEDPPRRTRSVEAARIDDYDLLDAYARADDSADRSVDLLDARGDSVDGPSPDPRLAAAYASEISIDVSVEVDGDELECLDIEPGEEGLSDWLGQDAEPDMPSSSLENAVDAEIDPLDDDALLAWEAKGLGNEVAVLMERRRPRSARTSIIEVLDDPFDAFDDVEFDDSLDAPFGFVDGSHSGEGPALDEPVDAADDWPDDLTDASIERPAGADDADPEQTGDDHGPRSDADAVDDGLLAAVDDFDLSLDALDGALADPFDDSLSDFGAGFESDEATGATRATPAEGVYEPATWVDVDESVTPEDFENPSTDSLIHGVDLGEAFPQVASPLGEGLESDEHFDSALDAAFADAGNEFDASLDSIDLDDEILPPPDPGRPRDPRLAASFGVAPRDPSLDSLEASLDAAFADPDLAGPAPAAADADADAGDDHGAPDDDVWRDAYTIGEAFPAAVVAAPTPAATFESPSSEVAPAPTRQSTGNVRFDLDAALADPRADDLDADADFPDDPALTGLDWPPPRALEAFPDGSVELPENDDPSELRLMHPAVDIPDASAITPTGVEAPVPPPPGAGADAPDPVESGEVDLWVDSAFEAAVAPSSSSLADALTAAREVPGEAQGVDAILDALEAPPDDDEARASARFAALAGGMGDDPWAELDIPDHSRGDTSPHLLPNLQRRRRQGRPPSPLTRARPLISGPAPARQPADEEHAPRAPLAVRVGLEAGEHFFTGFSVDISVDGIFVETRHTLQVGRRVEVFFELPGGRAINVEGRVRRIRTEAEGVSPGLGIRFRRLTREDRVYIGRYVARTLTGKIPLP